MTPKRYTQNSALIQWAYLFEEVRPLQTSTCALFWRSTVLTPLKLLGPAFGIGVVGLILFATVSHRLYPEWAHTTWMYPQEHDSEAARAARRDLTGLYVFGTMALVVAVILGGKLIGLWRYLHGFCYPVEIEGGLVKKGMCPSPKCMGSIVVDSDNAWRCRKCRGRFIPASEVVGEGAPS